MWYIGFQKIRIFPTVFQVLTHVLDTVLNTVRNIQRQVYCTQLRQLTIRSNVQKQVLCHQCGFGNTTVAKITDPGASFCQRIQHTIVHNRGLVLFPLFPIHQLDKRNKAQSKVTRHITGIYRIVCLVQVFLDLHGFLQYQLCFTHCIRSCWFEYSACFHR